MDRDDTYDRRFGFAETGEGLTVELKNRIQIHVMLRIVLRAKFPPDGIYDSVFLLSPFVDELIDACMARLDKDPAEIAQRERAVRNAALKPGTPVFKSGDDFTQAVIRAVDGYMAEYRIPAEERDALLRQAFKPHSVEGYC